MTRVWIVRLPCRLYPQRDDPGGHTIQAPSGTQMQGIAGDPEPASEERQVDGSPGVGYSEWANTSGTRRGPRPWEEALRGLSHSRLGRTVKRYDRSYFDRWYRGPEAPRGEAELRRSVRLAVAVTESILNRDIRTVLDVGAGEGRWQPILSELRPEVTYLGIEPSRYAVDRFGATRNLREGTLEELHLHVFDHPFDLVLCADVLHYLSRAEVLAGIAELGALVGGAAFVEIFTDEDPALGDREDFRPRPAEWYRTILHEAGLRPLGLQMWVHRDLFGDLDEMERLPWPTGGHAARSTSQRIPPTG